MWQQRMGPAHVAISVCSVSLSDFILSKALHVQKLENIICNLLNMYACIHFYN